MCVCVCVCVCIYSFCNLPYKCCTPSSKTSSPNSAIWCFLFQFPVSCHFLKAIQYLTMYFSCLPMTCIPPSILPSIMCFRSQFLHKMWSIQLAFLLFTVCMIFLSSLTLCNTSSFLTHYVQLIFSTQ